MSKDILQSRHALPRDLRQLVLIGGDVVDNNLKVALLPLATAWLRLHSSLLTYGEIEKL